MNTIQQAVFVAHQRTEYLLYTRLIGTVVNVVLSSVLMLQGYGIVSLLIAYVVVEYLVMIVLFVFINRYIIPLRWEFNLSSAGKLVWGMRSFAALSILAALFAQPEVIILSLLVNEEQIGYYSAAYKLTGFWYLISQMYMSNVYPILSRSYRLAEENFQYLQNKSIKYLLAISLPLTAGLIALAGPIVRLLYGAGFETAVLPLQILAWNIPPAFVGSVFWRVLAARNRQDSILWVRIITLLTRLGGGYLLIWKWGIIGAAICAPANLLISALYWACISSVVSISNYSSWVGGFTLAALAMGAVTWVLRDHLSIWLLVPLAGAIYLLLIVLLKVLKPMTSLYFIGSYAPQLRKKLMIVSLIYPLFLLPAMRKIT